MDNETLNRRILEEKGKVRYQDPEDVCKYEIKPVFLGLLGVS